jgi:hypothetical protein
MPVIRSNYVYYYSDWRNDKTFLNKLNEQVAGALAEQEISAKFFKTS